MKRLRLLRKDQETRERAVLKVKLTAKDFIYPYFVVEGMNIKRGISSLKGVYHFSIDRLLEDIDELLKLGINKILLFGVIDNSQKTETGNAAYSQDNLVARTTSAIKKSFRKLTIITDICLCSYTTHGHCGLVNKGQIGGDQTLPLLAKMALTHARAQADFVAPSAMMDGQVAAIRECLNAHGYNKTKILSYSVKYASHLYGPFREAVHSAPAFGDRKSYQMDFHTREQALAEVATDIEEGADWLMVKPAHTYLDIIYKVKQRFPEKPLVAYQVSGEYMMIKAACQAGYMNEQRAMYEVLIAIKRAGAQYIISYYAKDFAILESR